MPTDPTTPREVAAYAAYRRRTVRDIWSELDDSAREAWCQEMDPIIEALRSAGHLNEWRPISEAPKDGTPIIVWGRDISNPTGGYYPRSCWWSQEGHEVWVVRETASDATYLEPAAITHWQPLPKPPGDSTT